MGAPRDASLFAAEAVPRLQRAAEELGYLRRRGYPLPGALKLIGDRYQLYARQRRALTRATSAAGGEVLRAERRVRAPSPPPRALWVDGFNVIITLETALAGGVLVSTLDDTLRDLAGIHGAYKTSSGTERALELLACDLQERGWAEVPVRFLLDAPVSNTGRLAALIRARAEAAGLPWEVEVVPDPDEVLRGPEAGVVVASGDAPVLDACGPWLDWAGDTIRAQLRDAWTVPLVRGEPRRFAFPERWESARLALRPPKAEDASWIFTDYAQDPEVSRYLSWRPHREQGETEAFLAGVLSGWGERRSPWVLERQADGRPLGMFRATQSGPQAELGYVLAREHWGQGYMSELVSRARELGFARGIQRITALVDVQNGASARVLEKAGFAREGTLRSVCCHPNTCHEARDAFLYAAVRGPVWAGAGDSPQVCDDPPPCSATSTST